MGLKGFSYGLTVLALGCGLLAAGRLPSAGSGQPVLLVTGLLLIAPYQFFIVVDALRQRRR